MIPKFLTNGWFISALLLCTALGACVSQHPVAPSHPPVQTPDAKPVLEGQKDKDNTVVTAANKVDLIVSSDAPAVSAPVKEQTDQIRAAVAANPAVEIAKMVSRFDEAVSLLREQLKTEQEARQKAEKRAASLEDAELKTQARTLRLVAIGLLAVAGLLVYSRLIQYALAAGGGALLCFGLAQLVSQPWFMWACTGVVGLILTGFGIAAVHAYRKGELGTKVEKEATRFKATLSKVVPAIDSAMADLDDASKKLLVERLRDLMKDDPDTQAVVHEVRAALKLEQASK